MELIPRKIDKPKHIWLPAYFGGWANGYYDDDNKLIDREMIHSSYHDENDDWHELIDAFCDKYPGVGLLTEERDIVTMISWLCHLYEIEETPGLRNLAQRICTDKYGWSICKLERKELILLVEKNTHIQKEMFA